ncbi:SitI3 family protein [Vibrio ruber]|uniref:SitI3 family protein n=1 Tax=Vibrio ruber TaxID=184755 RepID=UPI0028929B24|nr:SitI3 family protein [Vibrio ruber]WNJ94243.1 SitI3 family protein [Vibrio ruber]
MSVDYELYLSVDMTESMLNDFGFVETQPEENGVIQGYAFDGKLLFIMSKSHLDDSFIRDEVGFLPAVKIILSPDLEQYDESMTSIIRILNGCVELSDSVKFYQNNEVLLLEKKDEKTVLYNGEYDWWEEHQAMLTFHYTEQ